MRSSFSASSQVTPTRAQPSPTVRESGHTAAPSSSSWLDDLSFSDSEQEDIGSPDAADVLSRLPGQFDIHQAAVDAVVYAGTQEEASPPTHTRSARPSRTQVGFGVENPNATSHAPWVHIDLSELDDYNVSPTESKSVSDRSSWVSGATHSRTHRLATFGPPDGPHSLYGGGQRGKSPTAASVRSRKSVGSGRVKSKPRGVPGVLSPKSVALPIRNITRAVMAETDNPQLLALLADADPLLGHTLLLFPGFNAEEVSKLTELITHYGGQITNTVASASFIVGRGKQFRQSRSSAPGWSVPVLDEPRLIGYIESKLRAKQAQFSALLAAQLAEERVAAVKSAMQPVSRRSERARSSSVSATTRRTLFAEEGHPVQEEGRPVSRGRWEAQQAPVSRRPRSLSNPSLRGERRGGEKAHTAPPPPPPPPPAVPTVKASGRVGAASAAGGSPANTTHHTRSPRQSTPQAPPVPRTKQERSPAIPRPSFLLVGEFDSVGRADVTRLVSMFGSTTVDTLMDEPDYVVIGGKCDVRSKGVRAVCAGAKECGARVLGETELLPLLRSMQEQRAGPAVIRAEEQTQHKKAAPPAKAAERRSHSEVRRPTGGDVISSSDEAESDECETSFIGPLRGDVHAMTPPRKFTGNAPVSQPSARGRSFIML